MRVAIVGAGFAANIHAEAYEQVPGPVRPVVRVVVDKDLARAEQFAKKHRVPEFVESLDEVLDRDDVDVVDLPVPTFLHVPFAVKALRAGKSVICEKPLTGYFGSPEGGDDLVGHHPKDAMYRACMESVSKLERALQKAEGTFCYAENWVYAPPVAKARKLLAAAGATILEMRAGEAHSGSHSPFAYSWKYTGGGSLIRQGAHPVGGVVHLKHWEGARKGGEPIRPKSVVAEVGSLRETDGIVTNYFRGEPKDTEDWAGVIITFEDGTRAIVNAGDHVLGGIENWMKIYADTCRIEANVNPNNAAVAFTPDGARFAGEYTSEKIETTEGWCFPAPDEDWMTGYPQEMTDFVRSVADPDREPLSGFELAKDAIKVIYAAYLSAERGQRVELD